MELKNLKLKFLNLGKKQDDDFIYDECDIRNSSWMEVIHKKFQDIIAWLIYDKEWIWVEFFISLLAQAEMELKFLLDKELQENLIGCNVSVNGKSKAETLIPKRTLYCEGCPYKSRSCVARFFYGYQSSGYCYYLGKGDFSFYNATLILWDGCKECGIGEDDLDIDFDETDVYNMSEEEMWREYEKGVN